jgi:2-oxoglutarate dehydrogenase E2 component (dihydrolipoamide succinyltransferase)
MPLVDLVMPKMGESIMEATILKWTKQPGDAVKQDETLLEIATDKVDSEVPSSAEGVLEEILFQVNDVVPIGSVIARIRTGVTAGGETPEQPTPPQPYDVPQAAPQHLAPAQPVVSAQPAQPAYERPAAAKPAALNGQQNRFYSPLVLNIAASEGVRLSELETLPGSGIDGRVTKKDILQYVAERKPGHRATETQSSGGQTGYGGQHGYSSQPGQQVHTPQPAQSPQQPAYPQQPAQAAPPPASTPASYNGNVEIMEMDRMRRLIADHMVRSVQTSPHVTSFTEADVTHLVQWREKVKKDFGKRENTKLTFTPLFIEAVVQCIKKYPLINSSLDGNNIIIKKDIHIGMATALPSGNLIVPVIRHADQLNLVGLTRQVNTLADNARQNKLRPEDTQGGTFTITNVGTFGSLMGTPIINQPQVAILAVGAIKKRPVVLESAEGDAIAIRHMMYLSLSYDHRIVDGSLGASFLTAIATALESFQPDREY